MKKHAIMILIALIPTTLIAGTVTVFDLSSPEKALEAYMNLKRKGGTLDEFRRLTSKELFASFSDLDSAFGGHTNLRETMPPEDRYATVTIVKKQASENRAIFQVKAKYKEKWLKQEVDEAKQAGMQDTSIPANQPTGGQAVSDPSPGEHAEYPYQINGEGFVSFLFVKQDGSWRFHNSYATNQPTDFTPLLKVKSLSGGITVTKNGPAEPEPVAPPTAPNTPLSGLISGKKWEGKFAYLDEDKSEASKEFRVDVVDREEPNWVMRTRMPHLVLSVPKKPGIYPLSLLFNITFYEPPGKNLIAAKGNMEVLKVGEVYKVQLVAHADKDNNASGSFSFIPIAQKP